ncbi:hypothetical protein Patl1_28130 [Pistacia atlantica]|uniref:Uncharacterized protein n=1 Tax=Pistacia atlantica TaxID=434234 RepID=A0ACC1BET7_9ROSI|nr:hypothetical protein Patl1_28130 [Pistacia atlantica]
MGSSSFFIFLFSYAILLPLTSSAPILINSISPNFTASSLQFIDNSGAFLQSLNKTFKLSFSHPNSELSQYYLSIIHSPSNLIIWTANPNKPISDSSRFTLSLNGLSITDDDGRLVWSTPKLDSPVSVTQLQDSGNLVLLDAQNVSLWESFGSPTDTLVIGQRLYLGQSLNGAVSGNDLSVGDYRLVVTDGDAVQQWNGLNYWKLSMYTSAFKNSNSPVSFLSMNGTGLYLFASDGSTVVIQVELGSSSDFRIAKLGTNGRFSVSKFVSDSWVEELAIPVEECRIPFICKKIGLCSSSSCSCPSGFHPNTNGDCVPVNASLSLPSACTNRGELNSSVTYLELGNGMDYFTNDFVQPVKHDIVSSECQDLCSGNCSCLAFFHEEASGSCYLIENHLGSIMSASSDKDGDRFGFIKTRVSSSPDANTNTNANDQAGFIWWRKNKKQSRGEVVKLGSRNSSFEELELISIPGLPVRSSPLDSWSVYFPLLALEMHEQRRYLELADPRLEGQVRREEVEKLVRVALLCVQEEPMLRPSMSNVVSMLEGGMPLGEPNIESLRFLRFYGQRFTEPSTIGNSNEQNEFILYSEANGTNSSANTNSASYNFLSYLSSQEVSGPR